MRGESGDKFFLGGGSYWRNAAVGWNFSATLEIFRPPFALQSEILDDIKLDLYTVLGFYT